MNEDGKAVLEDLFSGRIIKDAKDGNVPAGYVLWAIGKTFWFWVLVLIVAFVLVLALVG